MGGMKAIVVETAHSIAIQEVTMRPIGEKEVLIRVIWAGICATDLAIYSGDCRFAQPGGIRYPCRIGHEWSGIVEQVGEKVTRFQKGDRVIADNTVSCGVCSFCRRGEYDKCEHTRCVGTIRCWDGCFAEYMYMPEHHVYLVPTGLSLEDAALAEPASIGLGAVEKFPIGPRSQVAVLGTGAIALSAAACARQMGAERVIVIGRNDCKLQIALECGATDILSCEKQDPVSEVLRLTGGAGADFVIEASGAAEHVLTSMRAVRQRGTIALVAFYEQDIERFDADYLVSKELRIVGIMGEIGLPAKAADYIAHGLRIKPAVTRRIAFEEIPDYFRQAKDFRKQDIKVLVKMSEAE